MREQVEEERRLSSAGAGGSREGRSLFRLTKEKHNGTQGMAAAPSPVRRRW